MTQAERNAAWRKRYAAEVERSYINYQYNINPQQPVHTRKMTDKELKDVFEKKPEPCHKLKISRMEKLKMMMLYTDIQAPPSKMRILIDDIDKVKKFVETANHFYKDIDVVSGRYRVPANSLMSLFALDLSKPVNLIIENPDIEDDVRCVFAEFEVE